MFLPRHLLSRLVLMLVLAVLAGAAALWFVRGSGKAVDLAEVSTGRAVQAVYATGTVEPEIWAKIAPVQPGRLAEVLAQEGEAVRKGQVLARLDDREAGARVAELEAKAAYWREQMARSQALVQSGVRSKDAYEKDKSELQQVQSAIVAARQRRTDLVVVSPVDGVVLRRDFEPGEVVTTADALFWVGAPAPLRITADVDEEDIPQVAVGQVVLIKADAFPDQVLEAKVDRMTLKGDPVNKTFRVRVVLPPDTPLKVGMTAEINIITADKVAALLVPATALTDGSVFIVEDGRAVPRSVRTGIRGRKSVEVLDGLAQGQWIVANPPVGLKAGDRVRLR